MARLDKWVKRWAVESFTNPDTRYTVAVDKDGNYGCSCPQWRFRRTRVCKHIHFVLTSTEPEKAAMLMRQHNIQPLVASEWKLFILTDEKGKAHVGMTRDFGDRE